MRPNLDISILTRNLPTFPHCIFLNPHGVTLGSRHRANQEIQLIFIKVVELYPGRENAQKRADVLNQAGVPCGNGKAPWDSKSVMDAYRDALKRQGKPTLM